MKTNTKDNQLKKIIDIQIKKDLKFFKPIKTKLVNTSYETRILKEFNY